MELGVCYYPEQWPPSVWSDDAARMKVLGIGWVRIAEFTWSRIQPERNRFDWAWLDQVIDILHTQGLKVVMCTPTATPPKWLVDDMPEMLAVDALGHTRGFGSRRHYCFSHSGYFEAARHICEAVAQRYGQHPAVQAWQADNEYGCHATTLSYSAAARAGFQAWLQSRYGNVQSLNASWGAVFWSQEVQRFDQIELPNLTVTEANPAHRLDFQRYSSWAVARFQAMQYDCIKANSPGRPVSHNFMGFYTEFDHHAVSAHLDIATWDSYPLGFTQDFFLQPDEKLRYARTGHPDIAAFHHDLYRGMCASATPSAPAHGRWWVMEQQPGPVNWAQWNPAPKDGMVRLWTWQAFAHGAEVVSYFRWRQAPFAQEQNHAGLNRPDHSLDQGGLEAAQVAQELARIAPASGLQPMAGIHNRVALVFDYDSLWMTRIQPQGKDYNALEGTFRQYSALRQLGLDVDIVSPQADLSSYALIVLPLSVRVTPELLTQLQQSKAQLVFAPRSGSKTSDYQIPHNLAPGVLTQLLGLRVLRVASLPPVYVEHATLLGSPLQVSGWFEDLDLLGAQVLASLDDGRPLVTNYRNAFYVAGGLPPAAWLALLAHCATVAGLKPTVLPEDLRISRVGAWYLAFNFSDHDIEWQPSCESQALLGAARLTARDVSLWHISA